MSRRCLAAAYEVINYLNDNVHVTGVFKIPGREQQRLRILECMEDGDLPGLRHYLYGHVLEGAAALKSFIGLLPEPLFPFHIQELILADNPGIPDQVVAKDALGLMQQDVSRSHWELLIKILKLMGAVTYAENTSELHGCELPVSVLPVFLSFELTDVRKWKQAACVFNELIILASVYSEERRTRE